MADKQNVRLRGNSWSEKIHSFIKQIPVELRPEHITIAVTVYKRRDFVLEAVRSALNQTVSVKVIVVEDDGPDVTLRDFVVGEFGNRVEYFRNSRNRGLFDNWNACMECCRTPWISILHDDDRLRPNFVETMLDLAGNAPGRALYRGQSAILHEGGKIISPSPMAWKKSWQDMNLMEMADQDFTMMFPGNLFRVEIARSIGGVRPNSYYTGDWDFWFRLALHGGAAQSAADVAVVRSHDGLERGSSRVEQRGWRWALENAQRKRNLALLQRARGIEVRFNRMKHLEKSPIPSGVLLRHARNYSRRILRYNAWLFTHGAPPRFFYAGLQWMVRLFGAGVLRVFSLLRNLICSRT